MTAATINASIRGFNGMESGSAPMTTVELDTRDLLNIAATLGETQTDILRQLPDRERSDYRALVARLDRLAMDAVKDDPAFGPIC